jgi:hypothetical protein
MSGSRTLSDHRRDRATRALAGLGPHRSDHLQLGIQCRRAHHLAAVYASEDGLIYASRTGPHGHGSKDFIDTGRSGSRGGQEYVDLLVAEPGIEDDLPAWCDCGPRTLSRTKLVAYIHDGVRSVHVE